MRLFVSLELPEDTLKTIDNQRKILIRSTPCVCLTPCSQLHLTLRFLGNRNPNTVIKEIDSLDLGKYLPVKYSLDRTGKFGNPPRVFWISGRFSQHLFDLAGLLGTIPDGDGKTSCGRKYTPHITLARLKKGTDLNCPDVISAGINGQAAKINLVSSRLTSKGSVHTIVHTIPQQVRR